MGLGFHAFGDDFKVEGLGKLDGSVNERQIVGIDQHVPHERLVYFQCVDRQFPQVRQR